MVLSAPSDVHIHPLTQIDTTIYDLLLLADPSRAMIDTYLPHAQVYGAYMGEKYIGVIALHPISPKILEIKNVAVAESYQGKGIGTQLIRHAIDVATSQKYTQIHIGTANSSIQQLALYQKLGFDMYELRRNFFIDNYPEEMYENGIQVRHMIMLMQPLHQKSI